MPNNVPPEVVTATARKFPDTVCPVESCRRAVEVEQLDYRRTRQETECPNGHAVARTWGEGSRWSGWSLR